MLEFLNSGMLMLSTAAVIPIIIYLFVIKKPKRIVFSSIKHIKQSQKKQKSKIKLKNLLLLILRCLIILLAIAALSRPAVRSSLFDRWSRHSQVALAIILDTSYSMDYLVDTRTELEIGKEYIAQINQKLNEDDVVYLITSDHSWNRVNSVKHYGGINEQLLAGIEITSLPAPMKDLVELANNRLEDSQIANKEIHIITDFREQEYPDDNDIPVLLLPTSEKKDRPNLSAQNSRIEADYVDRKLERVVSFDIVNHSSERMQDVICQLNIEGRTVSEKITDIQPQQRKQETFTVNITEPGWYKGYVSVRNERLPYDTRNYFTFYYPEDMKVAVLTEEEHLPLPFESLLQIYVLTDENIHFIKDDDVSYERLLDYSLIVVDAKRSLTPRHRFTLERVKDERKGILYYLSENIGNQWKDYFLEKFAVNLVEYVEDEPSYITEINTYHPIMSIFEDTGHENIEVSSYWEARLSGDTNALISTNRTPLAVEKDRNILWLLDISDIRNRLILDPMYPVMAYRTFLYASYQDTRQYRVGDLISLPENEIILPNEEKITTNESRYTLTETGIYGIPTTAGYVRYIAVNLDYTPSNYKRIAEIREQNIETLSMDWEEQILIDRKGYEIWKHLLTAALLLLATEMYIVKKEENTNGG